jgi:ketosteroid isomerase-like protein
MATPTVQSLVEQVYSALGTGDRDTLLRVLRPDFDGYYSPGLPAPIGGGHIGAQECITQGWWAIGAVWSMSAEPERWLPIGTDELLVTGTYRGRARGTGRPVEAPFAHLWASSGDQLSSLRQYTDTALWLAALEETE